MGSFKEPDRKNTYMMKRQAIQVAGMLPDDPYEALIVLRFAKEIIENTFGVSAKEQLQEPDNDGSCVRLVKQLRQSIGGADAEG